MPAIPSTGLGDPDSVNVDPKSLTNILFPLAFYKQPPFPGEQAFHSLLKLIQANLVQAQAEPQDTSEPRGPTNLGITPKFLFSVCDILSGEQGPPRSTTAATPPLMFLPAVLACLRRSWRVLAPEARSAGNLALDLAALANGPSGMLDSPSWPPRLRIRWIGSAEFSIPVVSDDEQAELASDVSQAVYDCDTSCPSLELAPSNKLGEEVWRETVTDSDVCTDAAKNLDIPASWNGRPQSEVAAFRSGCGACRLPMSLPAFLPLSGLTHRRPRRI
jgi:hypothetical protein